MNVEELKDHIKNRISAIEVSNLKDSGSDLSREYWKGRHSAYQAILGLIKHEPEKNSKPFTTEVRERLTALEEEVKKLRNSEKRNTLDKFVRIWPTPDRPMPWSWAFYDGDNVQQGLYGAQNPEKATRDAFSTADRLGYRITGFSIR